MCHIAYNSCQKGIISIIDWRVTQCAARDVVFRFNTFANVEGVINLCPYIVIISTGGPPKPEFYECGQGKELVIGASDLIARDKSPGQSVVILDESEDHAGLLAEEVVANVGTIVEVMTSSLIFVPDIKGMNLVPNMPALQDT